MPGSRKPSDQRWTLLQVTETLQTWVDLESPLPDLIAVVRDWVAARAWNPMSGLQHQADLEGVWFGPIPAPLMASE